MSFRFMLPAMAFAVVTLFAVTLHSQVALDPGVATPTGIVNPAPGPRGVAVGDLNGDRFPDLVVSHTAANAVAVHLNDGAGNFFFVAELSVGTGPRGVAIGDLDGDGLADIVTANSTSNDVSVIRNLGAFAFAPAVHLATGVEPRRVLLADLDGNGFVDLVATNTMSDDVSLFFNFGASGFAGATSLALGSSTEPRETIAADLDGDGDLDLAVANGSSADVSILTNDGSGVFMLTATLPTGSSFTTGLKAGDMDGDGDLDLVVSNFLPSNLSMFENLGGGFFASVTLSNAGVHLQAIDMADLDFDGDLDVVVIDAASNSARVVANDGQGVLTPSFSAPIGGLPTDVVVADVDGDFIDDVVVTNFSANEIVVVTNSFAGPVLGDCGASGFLDLGGNAADVLLLNGSAGGPARRVDVAQGSALQLDVLQPPGSTAASQFLIWGLIGSPSLATVTTIPFPGIGATCIVPFHIAPASDAFVLTNNFGPDAAALVPSPPAPWTSFYAMPFMPTTLTLQGLMFDPTFGLHLTNGIILRVL